MTRLFKLILIVLLTCVIMGAFVSCNGLDPLPEGADQTPTTSTDDEIEPTQTQEVATDDEKESVTEEKTEEPTQVLRIVQVSLARYQKTCTIYWEKSEGGITGRSLSGVTRFLYRTEKGTLYSEISLSLLISGDGTRTPTFQEGDAVAHLIIVFEKGHKLTDGEKNLIKEFGIDYMFER